jgi:hypothetical protein
VWAHAAEVSWAGHDGLCRNKDFFAVGSVVGLRKGGNDSDALTWRETVHPDKTRCRNEVSGLAIFEAIVDVCSRLQDRAKNISIGTDRVSSRQRSIQSRRFSVAAPPNGVPEPDSLLPFRIRRSVNCAGIRNGNIMEP